MLGLVDMGHRVRCISHLTAEDVARPDYDASWRESGVEVYPVVLERMPASVPPSDDHLRRKTEQIHDTFSTLVTSERPDVVMVGHEAFAYYINSRAVSEGYPLVQVLHGTPTHSINDGIYPADKTQLFLDSLRPSTLIVGVSQYLARQLLVNGIKQVSYIHNGTDTNKFQPAPKDREFLRRLGLELSDTVLLHASNFSAVKRTVDIVEAAPYVIRDHPEARFLIVGAGPMLAQMQERVHELKLDDYFVFTGKVPFDDMPKVMASSDAFLFPSRREGFGRVVREAQACETVPVASAIGPLPEVICSGVDGLLYQNGDNQGFAASIKQILEDEKERRKMEQAARVTAVRYNLQAMVGDYSHALVDPEDFRSKREVA
tara:strand:- start:267 stop:1388 length:1122 start_codon:yes stop_codon:yes gene_type:complete